MLLVPTNHTIQFVIGGSVARSLNVIRCQCILSKDMPHANSFHQVLFSTKTSTPSSMAMLLVRYKSSSARFGTKTQTSLTTEISNRDGGFDDSRGPCLWPVLVRTCMVNHETLQVMWDPSPHSKHMQKSLDIKLLAGAKWWVSVQLSLFRLCLLSFFFFNLSMVYPGLVFLDCFAMICSHCISHNPSLFF